MSLWARQGGGVVTPEDWRRGEREGDALMQLRRWIVRLLWVLVVLTLIQIGIALSWVLR